MLTLRSTRFRGPFATLIVQECADRRRILIEMEDHAAHGGDHRRNIFLKAAQWKHLTQLPYLNRRDDGGDEHPPAGTFESTEFICRARTLRVVEMPVGDVVRIEMFKEVSEENDQAWLSIDLNAAQWLHLVGLDYVEVPDGTSPGVHRPPLAPPSPWLH